MNKYAVRSANNADGDRRLDVPVAPEPSRRIDAAGVEERCAEELWHAVILTSRSVGQETMRHQPTPDF